MGKITEERKTDVTKKRRGERYGEGNREEEKEEWRKGTGEKPR